MVLHSSSPPGISTVINRLTDRDRTILIVLGDHGVLTTDQIARGYFTSHSRAQHRLLDLHRFGLTERFRRRLRYGNEQWHHTLSFLGARIHAAATNARPPARKAVEDKILSLAINPKLAHLLGVNDFFIRILATTRTRSDAKLLAWDNEASSSRQAGSRVRPDGSATYIQGDATVSFWFEHDRGTEPLATVTDKLDSYDTILQLGPPQPVLIEVLSPAREINLHHHLAARRYPFTVATTHTALSDNPTDAIWWPLGTSRRETLADQT